MSRDNKSVSRYYPTVRLSRRTVLWGPVLVAALYVFLFSATAYAFVRLSSGNTSLYWVRADSGPISYTIQTAGSDDIPDQSEEAAIRMSFQSWNEVSNSYMSFVENGGSSRNRADWESEDLHLVFFDENNSSGFFTGNAGIVAVTPISFQGSGQITDADIILNGYHHRFSTDGRAGTFDVQDIVTHESGHFLGLDHSGVLGSTMYPFAFVGEVHQRSLTTDDVAGVTSIYPATGNGLGGIAGRAIHTDGSPIRGGHVVALNVNGEPTATLSRDDGTFLVSGLLQGQYQVYVEPLDGPVETAHLYTRTVQTDFGTGFWGGVGGGDFPELVRVSASQITTLPADLRTGSASDINLLSANPSRVGLGGTYNISISGSGFSGSCTASILGDGAQVLSAQFFGSGAASVRVQVSSFAEPGLRTLLVRDGARRVAALTGGIELLAAAPTLNEVQPNLGDQAGGTRFSLTGANFKSNARITVGGVVATDVTYVGPYRLDATAPASSLGAKDVVVINPDGQFAILRGGFEYSAEPVVGKVEPGEGPTVGGQKITITGANFPSRSTVLIGGQQALSVTVVSSSTIQAVTPPGSPSSVEVRVVLPNNDFATLANGYRYVSPQISRIFPTAGSVTGGTGVDVYGRGFGSSIRVKFGGTYTTSVQYVDSTHVLVTAPPGTTEAVQVRVENVDGRSANSEELFRYLQGPEPMIRSIQPTTGPVGGGTGITITGTGFSPDSVLWIGGLRTREATVAQSTQITGTIPAHEAGTVDVWVANPNGLTAVARGGFRYVVPAAMHQANIPKVKGAKKTGFCNHAGDMNAPGEILSWFLPILAVFAGLTILRRRARRTVS